MRARTAKYETHFPVAKIANCWGSYLPAAAPSLQPRSLEAGDRGPPGG
jgi:hypothetical protein